jgi:hypothetical protein
MERTPLALGSAIVALAGAAQAEGADGGKPNERSIPAQMVLQTTSAWRGSDGRPVTSTVSGNGRRIRDFRANITMVCPAVTATGSIGGQVATMAGVAQFARARVAPDGRFFGVGASGAQSLLVRGRLTGRRLTGGQAHLSVGPCTGSLTFTGAHA